jgi:Rrf2 family protein
MLTRSSEYAVRALSLLALKGGEECLQSNEIASELGLPPQFLTKILRRLTATGLVSSQRGRSGGFRLERPSDAISLLEVVLAFEPALSGLQCLLGQSGCADQESCPLHGPWAAVRTDLLDLLERTTLAQVAERSIRTTGEPILRTSRSGARKGAGSALSGRSREHLAGHRAPAAQGETS